MTAKHDPPERNPQPTHQIPTTFTFKEVRYGVDDEGKIWRRLYGGTGWVATGVTLEPVEAKEQYRSRL